MKSCDTNSKAAVAEAKSVMNPPVTERSRTPSTGFANASKDRRVAMVNTTQLCCSRSSGFLCSVFSFVICERREKTKVESCHVEGR